MYIFSIVATITHILSFTRTFNEPSVHEDRLQHNTDKLAVAIMSKLKSRTRSKAVIDFDHDCWRLLFHGKGTSQNRQFWYYERDGFQKCNFPSNWDKYLDGDGVKIKFPIKMKIHLSKSPQVFMRLNDEVVPRKRMYIERLTFDFIREPFTCN